MPDGPGIPGRVRELVDQLAEPLPMRRGSLSERYVKCSKPGCLCAGRREARHGPYFSLTRTVGGRTQSRFVPAEQVPLVRRQLEAGRRFRQRIDAYWEACERWADATLDTPAAGERAAGQKGGSPRPSRRRRAARSQRSSGPA